MCSKAGEKEVPPLSGPTDDSSAQRRSGVQRCCALLQSAQDGEQHGGRCALHPSTHAQPRTPGIRSLQRHQWKRQEQRGRVCCRWGWLVNAVKLISMISKYFRTIVKIKELFLLNYFTCIVTVTVFFIIICILHVCL